MALLGTGALVGMALASGPALAGAPYAFGQWPPDISGHGHEIADLYDIIWWLTASTFVLTEALLLYFCFRYRAREGGRAVYSHGNNTLEVMWTLIPVAIFLWLGLSSADLWARMKDSRYYPRDPFEVRVVAKQFEWKIIYPGPDGIFDTEDDYETVNDLHVPVRTPVVIRLRSEDVIHSFFVPELRVKQDAVPGMETDIYFEARKTTAELFAGADLRINVMEPGGLSFHGLLRGNTIELWNGKSVTLTPEQVEKLTKGRAMTYEGKTLRPAKYRTLDIACAELCGLGHYRMRGLLTIETREEFDEWFEEETEDW